MTEMYTAVIWCRAHRDRRTPPKLATTAQKHGEFKMFGRLIHMLHIVIIVITVKDGHSIKSFIIVTLTTSHVLVVFGEALLQRQTLYLQLQTVLKT